MKIKYIAWKKVISSDVNRLIYGTQGAGLHNRGDQAIQNFNTLNENPGLWFGFTGGARIPRKKEVEYANRINGTSNPTTYDILLANSVNPLRLWEDKNDTRHDPVKINHEIWDRNESHASAIIESWYLGYMRILQKLLVKVKAKFPSNPNVDVLKNFVDTRLGLDIEIRANVLKWIYDTQDGFCTLTLDTSFMRNENIRDLTGFIEQNFYVVVKCEENGVESNMALMANSQSPFLHPTIKQHLQSCEKGGEYVDIDVAHASSSPDAQRFLSALANYQNIILYGPPGTGKTHMLTELIDSFAADVLFDDLDTEAPFRITNATAASPTAWCTFHPSYAYENFVYGVKPKVVDGKLAFEPHIGPFMKQSLQASSGKRSLLIIDEINRGKADDIFGNTLAILDRYSTDTVYFPHPISVNGENVESLSTSENLFVVGTMNSLDKSTAPLSAELKRRFVIVEVAPSVEVLRSHLQRNATVDTTLINFCCDLMSILNDRIREFCGKEFEFGQGFFWSLVSATENHMDVLSDIICNKVLPHLRDVLPMETLADFFKLENANVLYTSNEYGFDFKDLSQTTPSAIINAFATAIGSDFRCAEEPVIESVDFDAVDASKVAIIKEKLLRHHNIIITGVSGTGKSYVVSQIAQDPFFAQVAKMFWHSSTDYSDAIEGINAVIDGNGNVDYSVLPGMIKQLAESSTEGPKIMIIEGINKSNPAEVLGELITLLEPDKRALHIEGYEGPIQLPENMYFICTSNPSVENQHKLDSAMKRRFVIVNLYPNYELLALKLGVSRDEIPSETISAEHIDNSVVIKQLAVQLLKRLNDTIAYVVGSSYQIGHSVFWELADNASLAKLIDIYDSIILPQVEEVCVDAEVARRIFGDNSPAISVLPYGIELHRLATLTSTQIMEALKGLLGYE